MATLSDTDKQQLLGQVKAQKDLITAEQLVEMVNRYDNLTMAELKPILGEARYQELEDGMRNSTEKQAFSEILASSQATVEDLETLEGKIKDYILKYNSDPLSKTQEAGDMLVKVRARKAQLMCERENEEKRRIEEADWMVLDKTKYSSLFSYLQKYPDSVHRDEIDDLMWACVKEKISLERVSRYITDMPDGRYIDKAKAIINEYDEWAKVKRGRDIFEVNSFIGGHPESSFLSEARALFYTLKEQEIEEMKKNPADYLYQVDSRLYRLLDAGIFTKYELLDEGLVTEQSWETMLIDRSEFPELQQHPDENAQSPLGCTDVFFFGTPSTGKTCLLMGLMGANGTGRNTFKYFFNLKEHGGEYASTLTEYVNYGIPPGSTFGSFVCVINGRIEEAKKKGKVIHNINLVEMSGEEFAKRIANNREVSFEAMGTGATNILKNNNRKVFFIIVDPTRNMVPLKYIEQIKDNQGNVVEERIRKTYISQNMILAKFVSLFESPQNQEIMKRVDAIHFVVTKADTLGLDRKSKAMELIKRRYQLPVEQLKAYCENTQRINIATGYAPMLYTFSLGEFYLGDVYQFDPTDTLNLVEAIQDVTAGKRTESWRDRFMNFLNR